MPGVARWARGRGGAARRSTLDFSGAPANVSAAPTTRCAGAGAPQLLRGRRRPGLGVRGATLHRRNWFRVGGWVAGHDLARWQRCTKNISARQFGRHRPGNRRWARRGTNCVVVCGSGGGGGVLCVCACEREGEREGGRERKREREGGRGSHDWRLICPLFAGPVKNTRGNQSKGEAARGGDKRWSVTPCSAEQATAKAARLLPPATVLLCPR